MQPVTTVAPLPQRMAGDSGGDHLGASTVPFGSYYHNSKANREYNFRLASSPSLLVAVLSDLVVGV